MILYHGSNISFDHIDLTKSLPNKDFGKGFYLSDNYEQAEEMAKFKVVISGGKVVVQSYQTEDAILENTTLKIKTFKAYTKEWAEFILANRNNHSDIPVHDYDIVYGPIANDKVGIQIRKSNQSVKKTMTDFEYMKEALATELVMMLMEKEGMDMKSALNFFYNSDTCNKLSNPESGLFFQSEGYVYALLHKEITTGTLD